MHFNDIKTPSKTISDYVLKNFLVCPECHTKLDYIEKRVICGSCSIQYPIHDGILSFTTDIDKREYYGKHNLCDKRELYSNGDYHIEKNYSLRKSSLNIYWKLQRIILPELKSSQVLYGDVLDSHINAQTIWLDLGCGHHVLPTWLPSKEEQLIKKCQMVVGVDSCMTSLRKHKTIINRIQCDIAQLPLHDNSFNLVTSNMVVEHLDKPHIQFKEINRILKPGGLFIFHTPNLLSYKTMAARIIPDFLKNKLINILEGRVEDDIFMTYYRANTRNQIQQLANNCSFDLSDIYMVLSFAELMVIPPLAVLELIWMQILKLKSLETLRPYIIAILKKKQVE